MKTKLLLIGSLLILLTGCTFNTGAEYDAVELAEYEACLSQVTTKAPSGFSGAGNEIEGILEWCETLKPSKR
jgi:hypothetical protein